MERRRCQRSEVNVEMLKQLAWQGLATADRYLQLSALVADTADVVLTYHSVGEPAEYGNVSTDRFRSDLAHLATRYELVDLGTIVADPGGGGRRIAVTFDDGCRNFYTEALPVLREHDAPATVFVVSGAIDGDPSGLNVSRTMTHEQLAKVADDPLVTIGNHTQTHPRLSEVPDPETRRTEILGAREALEDRFDIEVDRFCYPFGDLDRASLEVVRETHALAVTTSPGHVTEEADSARLPRIDGSQPTAMMRWETTALSERVRSTLDRLGVSDGRVTDPD
jgi:peptidoglycan/xylan/chitin deacetylase (PgdA/CDA1 family)